ncbi:helix-turn-helix transcriptional regulator [Actinospica sp. MGRD01-02]|uniref:Helix-turn-helix transcriptional regulator n=1 Tax=Actinospica acidithermotolerans TaxID=2828514 RepID=A0A941IN46_9ACTN|nr:helix-turn-helix transcriptional regulator [Actinospica acidithermotolerans]MBR7830668.1 helix-turn-helix transcriptional regulator [Actinospica acidithermotolerans]
MTLGAVVRELRESQGLSQAELAAEICKRSGRDTVSKREVRRWEADDRKPGPYSLRYLAEALGVEVEDLRSVTRRGFVSAASLVVPSVIRSPKRGTRRVGLGEVEAIDQLTVTIRQLDNEFGGGHVYGIAAQALNMRVVPMLRSGSYTEPVGLKLKRSAARLGHLCGWTAYDQRDYRNSKAHFDTAFNLSDEVGDRAFAGEILAAASHQEIHRGNHLDAVSLSRQGQEIAQQSETPALLAETRILEANAWALLGNTRDCETALHEAEVAFDRAGESNTPSWLSYMDSAYMAARFAHCFRDLGQMERARGFAQTAAEMSDTFHRTQASNMVMLASTFVDSDPDHGCDLGLTVLDLVLGLQSGRVVEYVQDLDRRLTDAHPERSSVVEFSAQVRESLGV